MIIRVVWIACLTLAVAGGVLGQEEKKENKTPTHAELVATTARGRMLADYDVAAWHATDAVEALKPDHATAPMYLAKENGDKWEVVFGKLSPDQSSFLVVYRATEGTSETDFKAKKLDPPGEDHGFYLGAAKALQTVGRDFGKQSRPYNTYILPTESGQLYVYFLPGQTAEGVWPLGGDVRYTVTLDGSAIVEKRQMHKTIIEKKNDLQPGQKLAAGYHTHALNNDVEDSDVFHVLTRKPSIPEIVGTPDQHTYEIETTGTIKRIK